MSISLRWHDQQATLSVNREGEFDWNGDTLLAIRIRQIIHEHLWGRGRYKSDELFLARRLAKVLGDCEIVDADSIASSLRDGWIKLLRDNLMPDPAAPRDHLYELKTWHGVGCSIETRSKQLSLKSGGERSRIFTTREINVGDPKYLRFVYRAKNKPYCEYKTLWERVVRIRFSFFQSPPQIVIESRQEVQRYLDQKNQS